MGVDGAGGHFVALALADRHGLAGEHAFINAGAAFGNLPVHREFFTRTNADMITRPNLFHRQILLLAITDYAGGFCSQVQQPTHGFRGLALGAKLQCLPQIDQADNHRRRLKIHVPCHFRQCIRDAGYRHGIDPGSAGPQGDQRIHVGIVVPERFPRAGEKVTTGDGHDAQGDHAKGQPDRLVLAGHHHGAEIHAPDHQAETESQTDSHLHQQGLVLLTILLLLAVVRRVRVFDLAGSIAGAFHRPDQSLRVRMPGCCGSSVSQVHVSAGDAVHRLQGALNRIHAGGTVGAGNGQLNLAVVQIGFLIHRALLLPTVVRQGFIPMFNQPANRVSVRCAVRHILPGGQRGGHTTTQLL